MKVETRLVSVILLIVVSIFSRIVFAPVINYYGKLAVASVDSSRSTMFVDVAYNTIYSVKASFLAEDGSTKN